MKNVVVCLGCSNVTVNDRPEMSISAITKLMIAVRFNPETIIIDKHVCANCRIHFPKEYCDKLMKDTPVVSP